MNQRPVLKLGGLLLTATLAVAACGARSNGTADGSAAADKVVKIGMVGPITGEISAFGLGIRNSVQLEVQQANAAHAIPGWRIEVDAEDDQAQPDVGKNVATKFASDPDLAAVVGPYNTGVSQQMQSVFAAQHIAQVSPGNTGPALSMGPKWQTAPKRQYDTYFRTCTTDAVQGPFAAQYIKLAGPASSNDLATSIGAPVEKLPSAKQFVADYAKAGFKDPMSPYGGTAYDAANAIIDALKTTLKAADSVESARQATVDAIGKSSFEGVTGHVGFDRFGDTTTRVLTMNTVAGNRWVAQQTKDFGPAK
ncbi:branched-chain amino acid ABC transporter substrate-binding protein [Kribbella sp. NPDC051770]|uniref:branched-chain amino acid ABC transporter substrate-binding protein n=1 Tax=Kribbella sp. NPDC051770 TaxID=3155413 RepID=UPI0034251662